jgi:hypothetical protein
MKTHFSINSTRSATAKVCRFAVCLVTLTIAPLVLGHSPVNPADIGKGHPTGHVTDHDEMTWPPQPEGIKHPVLLNNNVIQNGPIQSSSGKTKLRPDKEIERDIEVRPDVHRVLGTRFTRAAIVNVVDKNTSRHHKRMVYFSHDSNSTVEVDVEGDKMVSVKTQPASQYQPEITDEEIAEAEGIARAYYTEQGQDRVADLQAFGILAYHPNGKGFYHNRVIYISFHRDNDSPPEFEAWVDLTNRRVLRAREERS